MQAGAQELVHYGMELRQQVACWPTQTCHTRQPCLDDLKFSVRLPRRSPSCSRILFLCAMTCHARSFPPPGFAAHLQAQHAGQRCVKGSWLPVAFQQNLPARAKAGFELATSFIRGAESPHLIERPKYQRHPACPKARAEIIVKPSLRAVTAVSFGTVPWPSQQQPPNGMRDPTVKGRLVKDGATAVAEGSHAMSTH